MSIPRGNVVIVPAVDRTINLMPAGTSPLAPVRGLRGGPLIKVCIEVPSSMYSLWLTSFLFFFFMQWNIKAVDDTGFTLYVFSVADQPDRTLSILVCVMSTTFLFAHISTYFTTPGRSGCCQHLPACRQVCHGACWDQWRNAVLFSSLDESHWTMMSTPPSFFLCL